MKELTIKLSITELALVKLEKLQQLKFENTKINLELANCNKKMNIIIVNEKKLKGILGTITVKGIQFVLQSKLNKRF